MKSKMLSFIQKDDMKRMDHILQVYLQLKLKQKNKNKNKTFLACTYIVYNIAKIFLFVYYA